MLKQHRFEHDGVTYRCARKMTPPVEASTMGDFPRMAYWQVTRSDGSVKWVWERVGLEFDVIELRAATLQVFRSN